MRILKYVNVKHLNDNKIRKYNSENVGRIKAARRSVANR